MKRASHLLTALLLLVATASQAQYEIRLHNGSNVMYQQGVGVVDSLKFGASATSLYQTIGTLGFNYASIDSITFTTTPVNDRIYIIYNGSQATIINPFAAQGITITAAQGHVTSTSTIATPNIEYNILGTSTNGSLTLGSTQPVRLVLSNLTLTNPTGAAFNLNSASTSTLHLSANTTSTLSDATAATANAALLATGALVVEGSGTLNVSGLKKHAISTGTTFTMNSGTVIVPVALSDGIHCEDFLQTGGSISISNTTGDGVDAGSTATMQNGALTVNTAGADVKGLKATTITVDGGSTNVTVSGAQSKALKAGLVTINAGTLDITASGNVVMVADGSGYDPSYCTGIKSDGNIVVNGGTTTVTCTSTNNGGRGLSSDGDILINGGTLTANTAGNGATYTNATGTIDTYSACGIKSDSDIRLLGGTVNCTSSGTAGKGISADSTITFGTLGASDAALHVNVTTSGNRFLVSGTGQNADYANPKAVKAETLLTVNSGTININCTQTTEGGEGLESKAQLYIKGGVIIINTYDDCVNASNYIEISGGTHYFTARGNDGVDSNGQLRVSGGFTLSNGARAPEEGFDCDNNTFEVDGGIMVGTGGATSTPTAAASDRYSLKMTTVQSTTLCVTNSSGTNVLMMQLPTYTTSGGGGGGGNANTMVVLFSDPSLTTGTYTIRRGGTITGGTTVNGYNTGGTWSGGTTTNVTISGKLTTVTVN